MELEHVLIHVKARSFPTTYGNNRSVYERSDEAATVHIHGPAKVRMNTLLNDISEFVPFRVTSGRVCVDVPFNYKVHTRNRSSVKKGAPAAGARRVTPAGCRYHSQSVYT